MDRRSERKPAHTSDIVDWTEEKETSSYWRCGNPKKRREVVANFAQSSSVHGAAYVCSSGGRGSALLVKYFYRVLFGVCFLAVISSIVSLLQEKFSKQSTFINTINRDIETGYEEDPEYFPLYPRITICRRPFYSTDFNASHLQLVEYIMLSLGYPFTPLTPVEVATLVQLVMHEMKMTEELSSTAVDLRERLKSMEEQYKQLKKSEGYDLRSFINDHSVNCSMFFSSCVVLIFPVDCCLLFSPVLTSDGQCFTVRDVSPVARFLVGAPAVVFSVVIDLVTPPNVAHHSSEVGFRVFLTDPSEETPVQFDQFTGQDVVPGIATTIKASLIKTHRTALHTPWHGIWDTCPRWRYNQSYDSERFSHSICDLELFFRLLREKCDCESLLFYSGPPTKKVCEPIDMYQCYIHAGINKNEAEYLMSCKQPCTVYTYRTESSYMGLGGDSNISRLEIMYNAKQFTYNEYRKATLSGLFSQIGGSLGLYLGASIVTLVELVTFIASWLWYRLAPAKIAHKPAKVKPRSPLFTDKGRSRGNLRT